VAGSAGSGHSKRKFQRRLVGSGMRDDFTHFHTLEPEPRRLRDPRDDVFIQPLLSRFAIFGGHSDDDRVHVDPLRSV